MDAHAWLLISCSATRMKPERRQEVTCARSGGGMRRRGVWVGMVVDESEERVCGVCVDGGAQMDAAEVREKEMYVSE